MPTPKEILAVKRPKNTFVVVYGKNRDRYAVRKYVGCRYDKGRRIPVKGPTVGHIRDGVYVPVEADAASKEPQVDLRDWANAALCDRLFSPILDELRQFYSPKEAETLYAISVLRVCSPGVNDYELKERYEESFLSELHPGVALSKNTVCRFHEAIGKTCSRIFGFMRSRAEKIGADAHVLLDGTLKSNESRVNSLSDFSRKAKTKGTRDISVLYAFDLDKDEPVCSQCYPGNMLDVTSYTDFIEKCGVRRGVIVSDKGFPSSASEAYRAANPDLHQLSPVRRNATLIRTHGMLDYEGVLPGREGVTYKKARVNGGKKWLYSFRDAAQAALEERAYLERARRDGTFSQKDFAARQRSFGTIVLECDLDLDPAKVYRMYEERWQIEIVMRYYKSACEFDETRVHDDYSVIGSEFCDFLSTVLTFRLIKAFDAQGLLKKWNYSRLMSLLRRAKKVRVGDGGWRLIRVSPALEKILASLELVPTPDKSPAAQGGAPAGV